MSRRWRWGVAAVITVIYVVALIGLMQAGARGGTSAEVPPAPVRPDAKIPLSAVLIQQCNGETAVVLIMKDGKALTGWGTPEILAAIAKQVSKERILKMHPAHCGGSSETERLVLPTYAPPKKRTPCSSDWAYHWPWAWADTHCSTT